MLGTAAGGGCPQWNCRCRVCELAWSGDPRVKRRTQASLAVSVDGRAWCLLNCSPDIREQISAIDILQPRRSPRDSPVSDVVLTNADVDHIGGLLSLREGHRFAIHATSEVLGNSAGKRGFRRAGFGTCPAADSPSRRSALPELRAGRRILRGARQAAALSRRSRPRHAPEIGQYGGDQDHFRASLASTTFRDAPSSTPTFAPASPMPTSYSSTARCGPTTS